MKVKYQLCFVAIIAGIITSLGMSSCFAQNRDSMKVTAPFDSLTVDSIKATGNLKTGTLEIRMTFHNTYATTAGISLSLGGFADFSFTDEKGKNYKIYTDSHLIGTRDINKGYLKVPFVQFGDKKFDWVTRIQQDMSHGQEKALIVKINYFNEDKEVIREFHIRCILSLDYAHVGKGLCKVENIPVEWK